MGEAYRVYCEDCSLDKVYDPQNPPQGEINIAGSVEKARQQWSAKSAAKGKRDGHAASEFRDYEEGLRHRVHLEEVTTMSGNLPENWQHGQFHEDAEPEFEHEYLQARLSVKHDEVRHDAAGEPLPDGERREVYRIWITKGVPFAASEIDFEAPEPITSLDEAHEWAHQLMQEMNDRFSLDNHHYVGAAMNAVLGTDEYNDSGTMSAAEDYCCPICGVPLGLFRGEGNYDQLQNHLEYAEDEQHDDVSLSVTEREPGEEEHQDRTKNCDLCGDESSHLHTITSEPGLPTAMQSRLGICSGCHDALEAVDGDGCAWCGAGNASTVTVVGTSEGDYTLGNLCLDCQGVDTV